ncbi:MAG: sugar phosphate isomerase/epimerase [Oscillospiraceae bacterium]|jgi:sugar phosphate isomerase/epimerase|nr:sugar phosphate isomerase/epimerase [Oscillospiraceae bacterium]
MEANPSAAAQSVMFPTMRHGLGVNSWFFKNTNPSVADWQSIASAGFTEAEIVPPNLAKTKDMFTYLEEMYGRMVEAGLRVGSLHLPWGRSFDVSNTNFILRARGMAILKRMLDFCETKGIPIAVIHGSMDGIADEERCKRMGIAYNSIKELGAYAKQHGVALAVENLPRRALGNCSAEILQLTGYGKNAYICFDNNHLAHESALSFLRSTAPYVVTTHLSDYDGENEKHWRIGTGAVDWPLLFDYFEDFHYNGRYIFEFKECSAPDKSCVTPKQLMHIINGYLQQRSLL